MTNSLSAIITKLEHSGVPMQGLNESEIDSISVGGTLPQAYKQFLASMGKKAGDLFDEVIMLYPAIEEFRKDAYEIAEADDFALPASAYVFLIDDSGFRYFCLDEGDDPPVYEYVEGRKNPQKIEERFSAWLGSVLDDE